MKKILQPALIFLVSAFLCALLLEISLRAAGYWYARSVARPSTAEEPGDAEAVKVVCLGDSYTFGGRSDYQDRYPAQLQKLFDAGATKTIVYNEGICEANSSQVLAHLRRIRGRVDYAVLLVGSANRFNFAGYDEYRRRGVLESLRIYKMAKLLAVNIKDRLVKRAAGRLFARQDSSAGYVTVNGSAVTALTEAELKKKLDDNPRDGYVELGRYYALAGRFREAERSLLQAINIDPRNEAAYAELGACYAGRGENGRAEELYRRETAALPGAGYVALGRFYDAAGKSGQALKALTRSLEYDPRQGYSALGIHYRNRKQYHEAEAAFRKGLEHDPAAASYQLALLYAQTGRTAEAERLYAESVARFPSETWITYSLAGYYGSVGRYAEGVKCILTALENRRRPPELFQFSLLVSMYELQNTYSAAEISRALDAVAGADPQLARDRNFKNYAAYFRDRREWEARMGEWLENDLEQIARYCRQQHIRLIVQNYPYPYAVANEKLAALASRRSLPFIDNTALFARLVAEGGRKRYFTDNDHCTREGHGIMAQNIFRLIAAMESQKSKEHL